MSILDDKLEGEGNISPRMRSAFAAMSPWMRFIGVFGMGICGLYVLFLVLYFFTQQDTLVAFTQGDAFTVVVFGVLVIFFALGFGFYVSLLLFQSGARMAKYLHQNDVSALEEAFHKQKIYWIFTGVSLAISLAILLVVLLSFLVI
jgi:hypothetical protein